MTSPVQRMYSAQVAIFICQVPLTIIDLGLAIHFVAGLFASSLTARGPAFGW
jgi:hypothetical protein